MTDETTEPNESGTREKLEGFAQVVIGEIESLGGVITGDPTTSAEGDFNVQVGNLHREAAEALDESDIGAENASVETPAPAAVDDQTTRQAAPPRDANE